MTIILIDDLRYFKKEPSNLIIARNLEDGLKVLKEHSVTRIDELWLDHDLGEVNGEIIEIKPIVYELEYQAFWDNPYDIGTIFVHTSNPPGANDMVKGLTLRGYNVMRVDADEHLYT